MTMQVLVYAQCAFTLIHFFVCLFVYCCVFQGADKVHKHTICMPRKKDQGGRDIPCLGLNSSFICLINLHDGML